MGPVANEPEEARGCKNQDAVAARGFHRRTALKGLAGTAAASLVWAEPTIKGLARRPAYASAGTGSSKTDPFTFSVLNPTVTPSDAMVDIAIASTTTNNDTEIEFILLEGEGFIGDDGLVPDGALLLLAGASDLPDQVGCECGIDHPPNAPAGSMPSAELEYFDPMNPMSEPPPIPGVYGGGFYQFVPPILNAIPTRVSWTDIVVVCF